jgi:hypothetical protein
MRLLAALIAITTFGCYHEPSLDVVDAPQGWTRLTETAAGHAAAIEVLRLEYRERKTLAIETYESPATGDRLQVIRLRSQHAAPTLLARLAQHRGPGVYRQDTIGQLSIDFLDTPQAHHVGLGVEPEPSDDPDKVARGSILLASCIAGPNATRAPTAVDTHHPCIRAVAAAIDEVKDEADGSWMYWYIAGLVFASLVIGRRLLLGRRLLPPKSPSGLPVARVR